MNLLLNKETLLTVAQWITEYWWAVVLIGVIFVIFMGLFIKCCAVHTPSSNPKKPPARRISETLRRPMDTLRRMVNILTFRLFLSFFYNSLLFFFCFSLNRDITIITMRLPCDMAVVTVQCQVEHVVIIDLVVQQLVKDQGLVMGKDEGTITRPKVIQ